MKLLHAFCFVTIVLGSTVALPVQEKSQTLDSDHSETAIIDFTKMEKRAVSRRKITIIVQFVQCPQY